MVGIDTEKVLATSFLGSPESTAASTLNLRSFEYGFMPGGYHIWIDTYGCRCEGYEIVEEISDPGESGAYLERPGLDRVRDLVAKDRVDVVLAQDRDRFAREPAYLYLLREEFAKHGAKLRALNARGDDTPEGQLTEGMLDQLAKFERAKLAERTRRGRLEKTRRGGIKAGRIAKYGFKVNERRDGYLIDEETMPTAEKIIRAVAAGESLYGVTKMLEVEGVPTPNGSKNWNRIFVRNLIRDDAYLPRLR